jgi:hypothetical protein
MMTSVVAAGNGSLSNGFYRGIAPDANVVLVKLARTGRITEQNIQDGLEWILENRTKYHIRVVNISAGGDFEQSYLHDSLSQTVEECVAQGITIICEGKFCLIKLPIGAFDSNPFGEKENPVILNQLILRPISIISSTLIPHAAAPPANEPAEVPAIKSIGILCAAKIRKTPR